jgi:outer membrane protein TolC
MMYPEGSTMTPDPTTRQEVKIAAPSALAEAGTANRSAFLESEASVFSAQADVLRAEYDRSVAAADLARLTGNL